MICDSYLVTKPYPFLKLYHLTKPGTRWSISTPLPFDGAGWYWSIKLLTNSQFSFLSLQPFYVYYYILLTDCPNYIQKETVLMPEISYYLYLTRVKLVFENGYSKSDQPLIIHLFIYLIILDIFIFYRY